MMSLHVAPRRPEPVAGVVGISGRLLEPDRLEKEAVSRPPILLLHGDKDEMVPPSSLPEAAEALSKAGFEVYAHVMKGTRPRDRAGWLVGGAVFHARQAGPDTGLSRDLRANIRGLRPNVHHI